VNGTNNDEEEEGGKLNKQWNDASFFNLNGKKFNVRWKQ